MNHLFVKNTGNVDLNTVTVTENSYDGLEYDSFKGDLWTHSIVNGKHVYRFNHILKIPSYNLLGMEVIL